MLARRAAAAALWLTLKLLPLSPDGLGQVLAAGRRAALDWAGRLARSASLTLYQLPELDIVCYFPAETSMSVIDARSADVLQAGMADPSEPVYLSTLRVTADALARRHPGVVADADGARILRSVLMKPEHEAYVPRLHERVQQLAAGIRQ